MNLKIKFANFFSSKKQKKLEDDEKKNQIEVKINMQCTKHNTFDIILHCVFSKNAKHILHCDQKQVYHSILYHHTCNQFLTPVY